MRLHPTDFTHLTQRTVRSSALINFDREPLHLDFADTRIKVELVPNPRIDTVLKWLAIDLNGSQVFLGITRAIFENFVQPDRFGDLSDEALLILFEALCGAIQDVIPQTPIGLSWIEIPRWEANHALGILVQGQIIGDTLPLFIDQAEFPPILNIIDAIFPRFSTSPSLITAYIDIHSVWLTRATLLTLRQGDVIIVDHTESQPHYQLTLENQFEVPVEIIDGAVHLLEDAKPVSLTSEDVFSMSIDPPREDENGSLLSAESVAKLPVKLDFSLAKFDIPANELANIGSGYVFDLGLEPTNLVKIRLGGKIIGYGEIVLIDDNIGVRVTKRA